MPRTFSAVLPVIHILSSGHFASTPSTLGTPGTVYRHLWLKVLVEFSG